MVTALPVQQQTAGTLTCGVIAIALTYHFPVVIYYCTSVLHMFATRMDQHENDTVRLVPRVVSF